MSVRLLLPLPPAGLRRNHAAHWRTQKGLKDDYSLAVLAAVTQQMKAWQTRPDRLDVTLDWRQVGQGDTDNCLAGAKVVLDILGCAPATNVGQDRYYVGLYESDSQIEEITVRRTQVKHKTDEGVLVTILKGEA